MRRLLPAAECGLLAAFAVVLVLHYGSRGFMPLDQSIVYDGGWRTLHGQVPFRDYITPFGVPSFVIQAGFFAVFGVSWLAYVLHAAVFNALFAVAVLALLRLLAVSRWIALPAAALSAIVFYPPVGTGFADLDAFLFVLLAVTAAAWAATTAGPRLALGLWASIPALILVATLCKEVPGVLGIPLVLVVAACARPGTLRRALLPLAAGTAGCVVLTAILIAATGMRLRLIELALIELPLTVGGDRTGRLFAITNYTGHWRLLTAQFAYLLYAGAAVLGWRAGLLRRGTPELLQLVVGFGLFLSGEIFWVATNNNIENAFAFVFPSMGLLAAFVGAGALRLRVPRAVLLAAAALAAVVCLRDAYLFDRQANGWRIGNDLLFRQPSAETQREVPSRLSFLRWQVPPFYGYTAADLSGVASYLRARPGNFMLVGDTSVLYALADRPSTLPAMFLAAGEGYPRPGATGYATFSGLLEESLRRWRVRRIVTEEQPTWMGSTLADFPPVERALARTCGSRTFGSFVVHELCASRTR